MTQARSSIVKEDVVGTYHCISRCVRRAFICGFDQLTGKDYEHRKQWLHAQLIELADIFLIDVCGYAIMENHLHAILRNRPDLSAACSDEEIARRWWKLFPRRRTAGGRPADPTREELLEIQGNKEKTSELRSRLSSISWFMGRLKEPIARRANAEDECTGRFWEGRFKCIALLDQAAILTCSAYVDLNPVRAGVALDPESSRFTSAKDRITTRQARKKQEAIEITSKIGRKVEAPEALKEELDHDRWLCPLRDEPGRRGYLNMDLDDYLELLDWTGRQIIAGKRGAIPSHLAPILTRLEIDHEQWLQSSRHFGPMFYRVAGTISHMTRAASRAGQKWLRGKRAAKTAFLSG